MDNSLEQLLKQVLELEGLILVAQRRGEETPLAVHQLISEKAAQIGAFAAAEKPADEPAKQNAIDALPDDEPDDDITLEFVDEDADTADEDADATDTAAADEEPQPEPEVTVVVNDEPEVVVEVVPEPKPAEQPEAESQPEPEPEPEPESIEEEATAQEAADAESEPEIAADAEPVTADDFTTVDDEPVRLDEALQRNMVKDLHHAFSLNDRFRYRRELFGNSDQVMEETLNHIESMATFDEAENYFYNDLEWEYDSPEVADFMVIIKNYFWNKRPQL